MTSVNIAFDEWCEAKQNINIFLDDYGSKVKMNIQSINCRLEAALEENITLNDQNNTYKTDYENIKYEMENHRKVSIVSNFSRQITERDREIVLLKKKILELKKAVICQTSSLIKDTGTIKLRDSGPGTVVDKVNNPNSHSEDPQDGAEEPKDVAEEPKDVAEELKDAAEEPGGGGEELGERSSKEILDAAEDSEEHISRELIDELGESLENISKEIIDDVEEQEDKESDSEEIDYEIKKIKKKYYYISNEKSPKAYKSTPGGELGEYVGLFVDNKIIKSTN